MMSQYNRRRSDPERYGSHGYMFGGEGRRREGRNYHSMGGGGYGYGHSVGYEGLYGRAGAGYGPPLFDDRSLMSGGGRGVGRDHGGLRVRGEGQLPGHQGQGHGYCGWGNRPGGGYRENSRGGRFSGGLARAGDRGVGGRGHGKGTVGDVDGHRVGEGRGRGGRGDGRGREPVQHKCVVRIAKLPREIRYSTLKNILTALGLDNKLQITEFLERDEEHKVAIVNIVETGPVFLNKVEQLVINGEAVVCTILEDEEVSNLQSSVPAQTRPTTSRNIVRIEFPDIDPAPTQKEVEEKIQQVGLETSKNWRRIASGGFSVIITKKTEERKQLISALKDLNFGEKCTVSVKETKSKNIVVKVNRAPSSFALTNLPEDLDAKKLKMAIKKALVIEVSVTECKEGTAQVTINPDRIEVVEKLVRMKFEGKAVRVDERKKSGVSAAEEKTDEKTEEVSKTCLPAEEKLTKEEEKNDVKEEEENEIEKSEEDKEKSDVDDPLMFEDKPVIFASTDVREKKKALAMAHAEAEVEAQSEAEEPNSNETLVNDIKVPDENGN